MGMCEDLRRHLVGTIERDETTSSRKAPRPDGGSISSMGCGEDWRDDMTRREKADQWLEFCEGSRGASILGDELRALWAVLDAARVYMYDDPPGAYSDLGDALDTYDKGDSHE